MNMDFRIPDCLIEVDQWVLWRWESVCGRKAKVPYSVVGRKASSIDSRTWAPFEIVLRAWQGNLKRYTGIGFVFLQGGGMIGIYLDQVLDGDGNVKAWGRGIIEKFFDTYMEISPSGSGIKIWLRGAVPANLPGVRVGDGQIEMYDHSRYFTVTGRVFREAPLVVENHAQDVLRLYQRLRSDGKGTWPIQPLPNGRIPYGRQHSTLVSIAGTLRARNVCDDAILACLQIVNAQQCERPGPPEHIERIVRSTRHWESPT